MKLREDQTDPSTWNWVSLLDLVPEESVKVAVELPMTQILDTTMTKGSLEDALMRV